MWKNIKLKWKSFPYIRLYDIWYGFLWDGTSNSAVWNPGLTVYDTLNLDKKRHIGNIIKETWV